MKFEDIKVGMKIKTVKSKIKKSDNMVLESFPDFIETEYRIIRDLKTQHERYILFNKKNEIAIITKNVQSVVS